MSDTKKRIVVSAGYLSSSKTKKKRAPHKLSPSKLKEQFIKKVRALQKDKLLLKMRDSSIDDRSDDNKAPKVDKLMRDQSGDSFKESMSFLQDVSSKSVLRTNSVPNPSPIVPSPIVPSPILKPSNTPHVTTRHVLKPCPPYSSLKNSDKPTYRQWKAQTAKRPVRAKGLQVRLDSIDSQRAPSVSRPTKAWPTMAKNTSKRTVKVGKSGNRVSLIIYGSCDTKKSRSNDLVSDTSSMRHYLRSRNLLKNGSQAPNDIVRSLYKESQSAGEVNNNNGQSLLENLHKE
jgi:hypothetical protein